jgi:superoxide dismutase, Cu-Zn family
MMSRGCSLTLSLSLIALTVLALTVLSGCSAMTQPVAPASTAVAEVKDAKGTVVGTATLTEVPGGVRVLLEARGLPPGPKGVHIHEVGRCEAPAFTSAGGHFNPRGTKHGLENPEGPHAGDLPNITIGPDGAGRLESMNDRVTLGTGQNSLFDADGSALVVHAGPDDFKTDPAGGSGARIACGVITKR